MIFLSILIWGMGVGRIFISYFLFLFYMIDIIYNNVLNFEYYF